MPCAADLFARLSPLQLFALACFSACYILFILLSVVLLLNLLIALLTHTFDEVLDNSTLEARLHFSRYLIKLELLAEPLGMRTRVGERALDGRYLYSFFANVGHDRDYGEEEGDIAFRYRGDFEGSTDPFKDPTPTPIARIEKMVHELRTDRHQQQLTEATGTAIEENTISHRSEDVKHYPTETRHTSKDAHHYPTETSRRPGVLAPVFLRKFSRGQRRQMSVDNIHDHGFQ